MSAYVVRDQGESIFLGGTRGKNYVRGSWSPPSREKQGKSAGEPPNPRSSWKKRNAWEGPFSTVLASTPGRKKDRNQSRQGSPDQAEGRPTGEEKGKLSDKKDYRKGYARFPPRKRKWENRSRRLFFWTGEGGNRTTSEKGLH